jgi:hypothetical protein
MVKEKLSLGLAGNYNSTSLWNARLWFDKKWNNDRSALLLDLSYNKPLEARSETWLGLQSTLNFDQWGQLSLQGKYEVHNQALANLSYNNMFLKKITSGSCPAIRRFSSAARATFPKYSRVMSTCLTTPTSSTRRRITTSIMISSETSA